MNNLNWLSPNSIASELFQATFAIHRSFHDRFIKTPRLRQLLTEKHVEVRERDYKDNAVQFKCCFM